MIKTKAAIFPCICILASIATLNPPAARAGVIAVNTRKVHQTMDGTGGAYARLREENPGVYNLAHLHPNWVRVQIPLRAWAATSGTFSDSGDVHDNFLLMQKLHHYGAHMLAAIWDAPDWMVTPETRGQGSQRVLDRTKYPDFVKALTAFLARAKSEYGVEPDYLSLNEADAGYDLLFKPEDEAAMIALAGPALKDMKLPHLWLAGEASSTAGFLSFAPTILADKDIQPYLGPASFHSWDNPSPAKLQKAAALAAQYHKVLFCTEIGYNSNLWQQKPPPFSKWAHAWRMALLYQKLLLDGRVSVPVYWEYEDDYPLLSDDSPTAPSAIYPVFYIVKQLADNLPPGSKIVDAISDDPTVEALAATSPRGGFMVQALTNGPDPVTMTFTGLPNHALTLERCSLTENMAVLGTFMPNGGNLTVTLSPQTMCTLTTIPGTP